MARVGRWALLASLIVMTGLGGACMRAGAKLEISGHRQAASEPVTRRGISPRLSAGAPETSLGEGRIAAAGFKGTMIKPLAGSAPASSDQTAETARRPFGRSDRESASVYFDSNQAELRPSTRQKLRQIAAWLLEDPRRIGALRLEGDCDARGTEAHLELGARRARKTREFLAALGIGPDRIEIVSYGSVKACGVGEGVPEMIPSTWRGRNQDFTPDLKNAKHAKD
ncbi:MAG TPA: OmpA family protein [Blastocatellia bacterium]|nr:OmpA family protein [Blastocatellia bacterium]